MATRSIDSRHLLAALLGIAAACGGDATAPTTPTAAAACTGTPVALAPGDGAVLDPATTGGCVRLPAAGPAGAEYLVDLVATATTMQTGGVSDSFQLAASVGGQPPTAAVAVAPLPAPSLLPGRLVSAVGFENGLRDYERTLSRDPALRVFPGRRPSFSVGAVPPAVGDRRGFNVLASTTQPYRFTQVSATVRYVGTKVAIFLDDSAPAGGYTQADLDSVGTLFDQRMYAIDTAAFGTESDIDGNGVVDVLLTPAINKLSPDCNTTGAVVLGFFFGLDLLPSEPNSNAAEVFYGLVPSPSDSGCSVNRAFATRVLPVTFIHEFQHMINFNQHVLLRGGEAEATWLNEGLSHFAEELGARSLPDAAGAPAGSRFSQFAFGDVDNAYHYLLRPEQYFMVEPVGSLGTLPERGANWLFVRWLVDHFDTDSLGRNLTAKLLRTSATGAANVQAATGEPVATLLTQWQLADYLNRLPGFADSSGRFTYRSWSFRATFADLHAEDATTFPLAFPLVPDSAGAAGYRSGGTLRGGSARLVRVVQPANGAAVELRAIGAGGAALPAELGARFGVVRIR